MAEELTTRDTQATGHHSQVWGIKAGDFQRERKRRELGEAVINQASRGKLGLGELEV